MTNLTRALKTLRKTLQHLREQLDAVESAIAALESMPAPETEPTAAEQTPPAEDTRTAVEPVAPTILKPRRVLKESHRHAMIKGRRKARDAKDVVAGLAREMPDESFVPALSPRGDSQQPRLVKKRGGR